MNAKKVTRQPPMIDVEQLYEVGCRFDCNLPVVAIARVTPGCTCWSDRLQALCEAHLAKAQSLGVVSVVVDFRGPA
jgi:hypothetical protein